MILRGEDFIEKHIQSANILFSSSLNSNHLSSINAGENLGVFFKCTKIPCKEKFKFHEIRIDVEKAITQGLKQLTESKEIESKFALVYQEGAISFPYVCLFHQPILGQNLRLFSCVSSIVQKGLSYKQKINLMMSIAEAVEDFHLKKFCLRSLTTENIAIVDQYQDEFEIAFSEMGDFVKLDKNGKTNQLTKSPEVVEFKAHSLPCDIWTLGTIFYRILFERCIDVDVLVEKQNENDCFPVGTPRWISNFIYKMVEQDPIKRHTIKDVMDVLRRAKFCSEAGNKFFKCK